MERYSAADSGRGRDGQDGGRGRRGRGRGRGREGGPARGAGRGVRGGRGGGGVGGIVDWGPAGGRFRGSTSSAPSVQTRIEPQNISTEELPEPIVPAMQSLAISTSSAPEDSRKRVPIKRPDNGGENCDRPIPLRVNHFLVRYDPERIIWHYDVNVKPDLRSEDGRAVKLPKTVLSMIRNKLFSDDPDNFPLLKSAYDGEKNIFSAEPLPTGTFKVGLSNEEGIKIRYFTVEVQLVNELKCSKLGDYKRGEILSTPRDVLQALDVIMKENPTRNMIFASRSFHPIEPDTQVDLHRGITASRGIKHSLKPTFQGLALCMDYSVLPFRKQMPVIDFLQEHIPGFNPNNFRRFKKQVEEALEGLNVTVTHRTTNQKYKIAGLTDQNTRDISFDVENPSDQNSPGKVNLVSYFRKKYNKDIIHMDIPCLALGKSNRKNYVPMEFCIIAGWQRYAKELLDVNQLGELRKISLVAPKDRQRTIRDMVENRVGPCSGDIIQNFGISVDVEMTTVIGQVLKPPELKLDTNLRRSSVITSEPIREWGILFFGEYSLENFAPELISRSQRMNIRMDQPRVNELHPRKLLLDVQKLEELLERIKSARLQILVCVLPKEPKEPKEGPAGYNNLKWISETKVGILTQCCLAKNCIRPKDQFLANLALKINAKLGGSNVELIKQPNFLQIKGHVMFVGADVNHPRSYNTTSPSIAAVVGTMNWPAANQYSARICPQDHRAEKILKFGSMCMELVNTYTRLNQAMPKNIILFRDGVSDGQFDMVLNEELTDLKMTFQASNYSPRITVVVAQKRHTTRLFLDGNQDGNVPPGTVVDTTIIHPCGFEYYLCSHYGSIGTSKPARYRVLWDENGFTSDQLQELTYGMCFTCAQCTKSVSLVPPVLYADRAAYRGRLYHDVIEQYQSSAPPPSTSSTPSFDEQLYKLHSDLENSMFFM